MKKKTITLMVVLALIVISIYFLESRRSEMVNEAVDSGIKIEDLTPQVAGQNDTNQTASPAISEEDIKRIGGKAEKYPRAKELVQPDGYINTDYINITENIGKKVILVDFWTYSCINCQRTLPYLTSWYDKYKDEGLLIIGVHTPEFEFEKNYDNVKRATEKFGIKYPVVLDNEYLTWRAYGNRYWPRKYLIDIDGFIVYDHIGEGGYAETETKIQSLLEERKKVLGTKQEIDKNISKPVKVIPELNKVRTPEIYFGYSYSREQFGNSEGWQPEKVVSYTIPAKIKDNMFYLEGRWMNNMDNMELVGDTGRIVLSYDAKDVNLVAGSEKPVEITVLVDGVMVNKVEVSMFDLYNVVKGDEYSRHTVEIEVPNGLMAYTFTFG